MSFYPADYRSQIYAGTLPTSRRQGQRQQRDFSNPREPIANDQPQQQEPPHPSWHMPLAFPGNYFDPFTADPILTTANDIDGLVRAFTAVPRFLYFSVLLFLPFFYHTRVHQIFNGVHLTENEIASHYVGGPPAGSWRPKHWDEVKLSWTDFIDSTLKERSTLNIVSVLLLSAIYNLLQLGGSGSHFIQCTALMSLISALTSLVFGCLYVIRFETMRRPHKAMQWAQNALHSSRNTLWNVFVLLSLPFVWLAWSIILFIICLMSVIWQTSGQPTNTHSLTPLPLDVKIITSAFLFIGLLHLCLILVTFSQYGDIDEAWSKRFKHLVQGAALVNGPVARGPSTAWPTAAGVTALPRMSPPQVNPYSHTNGPHRASPSYASPPGYLNHDNWYMLPYEAPTQTPQPVVIYAGSEETSETRHSPAPYRQGRRGPHRRERHRHRYSEDSSEESEPHPSASHHRNEPTQARYHRSEDSSEDTLQIPSPERRGIQSRRRRRRRRRSRGSVESTHRPSRPVVQFATTPSSRTTDRMPAPSGSSTALQHNQTQRQVELVRDAPLHADNTSLYSSGGDGNQNDPEPRQSVAPRSRRGTSDNLSLSGVNNTPQPEPSQNRGVSV